MLDPCTAKNSSSHFGRERGFDCLVSEYKHLVTLQKTGTVAVDLDGTLAKSKAGKPFDPNHIGEPVKKMMDKVQDLLSHGKEVVLFTARASDPKNVPPVRKWLDRHKLHDVKITNEKTPDIEVIYDDRAKGVHKNLGTIKSGAAVVAPIHSYTLSVGPFSKLTEEEWVAMLQKIEKHTGEDLKKVPVYANRIGYFDKVQRIASRNGVIGKFLAPLEALTETRGVDYYTTGSGSVNMKHPSYPILAHEVGHWMDFERAKGVYKRKGHEWLTGATGIPQLDAELNASLFARKAGLSPQQKGQLDAALGSYLLANHMKILTHGIGPFESMFYNHKKDPKGVWAQDLYWPDRLQKALEAKDQAKVQSAMRTALVTELNLNADRRAHRPPNWRVAFKAPLKIDGQGKVMWKRKDLSVYPLLAKTLLDLEEARTKKVKTAALPGVSLKPHQQRVVSRVKQPGTTGLLAQHGLGSGKTLSSIATWDAMGRPNTAVIVPAALQENYRKELTKWVGKVPPNVNIMSQQRVARQGGLPGTPPELMIVDEQHKAREQGSALRAALSTIKAKKRLLLTGTPIYNHPHDIAASVNLAAGKNVLPPDRASFNDRYVSTESVSPPLLQRFMGVRPGTRHTLKNRGELGRILRQYIDYHPNSTQGFPRSNEETIKVPMAAGQTDIYNSIMGKAPGWVRWKVKSGLPPGKGEFEAMRAFLTGARQVSNTSREFTRSKEEAAKVDSAFRFFQRKATADPAYKAVVYSNYLRSGLLPYKERLTRAGIPFGEFSGDMDRRTRDDMVRQYNDNKLRALLISSAGAEGLDLKGTRLIQLLEPHFNEEKEKQIIGRGIRYGSHAALPPEQQHVLVQRYLAQPRGGWFDRLFGRDTTRGADEYIRNLALQKSQLNNQVQELLAK